jgi:DNA-binding SARP family transcriptional activator
MSTLKLSAEQWRKIRAILHTEHPKSVFMLKHKMKSVLGFIVREHNEWVPKMDGGYSEQSIRLDFYNERKYTMFMLKFSEYLHG